MDHQDFNPVVFNSKNNKVESNKSKEVQKSISQLERDPETTKIESAKKLGLSISQARTTKGLNQKQLSSLLGISSHILSRWELEREIPSNENIAKIERTLGVKLPRNKKVKLITN